MDGAVEGTIRVNKPSSFQRLLETGRGQEGEEEERGGGLRIGGEGRGREGEEGRSNSSVWN